MIVNSGSTNTTGYQLEVSSDGSGAVGTGDISQAALTGQLVVHFKSGTVKDAGKFFRDLNAAMPLTSLPVRHGMRSASFGTATYVTYKGQQSPDLTFASDPRTVALKADIDSITKSAARRECPAPPDWYAPDCYSCRPIILERNTDA